MRYRTQEKTSIQQLYRRCLTVAAVTFILWFPASAGAQSLLNPVRIARAADGDLLVSDFTLQGIVTLNHSGLEAVDFFDVDQRILAVGRSADRLYVGNASAGRVEVYDLSRRKPKLLFYLGGTRKRDAEFVGRPTDLAIDEERGLVFVVDGGEKVIKVFSVEGPLLYAIPKGGPNADLLANPTGIALDEASQEVVVSDYGDPSGFFSARIPARVQIFDYAGALVGQVPGDLGLVEFRFSRPQGLVVDSGKIYMVDAVLGRVMVYDRATSAGVATLGKFGTNPGELFAPTDIVVDNASGDVFVTSSKPARVEAFRGALLP